MRTLLRFLTWVLDCSLNMPPGEWAGVPSMQKFLVWLPYKAPRSGAGYGSLCFRAKCIVYDILFGRSGRRSFCGDVCLGL